MTLDFLWRGLVQVLAAYAVLSSLGAMILLLCWTRLARHSTFGPARLARLLFTWRLLPVAAAGVVAFVAVPLAYLSWEPRVEHEPVGPVAQLLAAFGGLLLGSALVRVTLAVRQSHAIRTRLQSSAAMPMEGLVLPAVRIESAFPIVALVGVSRPTLFVAGAVVDACTRAELRTVVAHETAHLRARDNLRRALVGGAPDLLAWCRAGARMERDWAAAVEIAADEAAVAGDLEDRLHLASALVKVARLATTPPPFPVPASALYSGDPVADRVKRLVEPPMAREEGAIPAAVRLAIAAALAAIPLALPALYAALEALLRLRIPGFEL
jgi:beta-lactamase regulating signal transducer with metallopeptidase domain